MQTKNYADSDFFLALMKESDWLKQKAINIYKKHKDNIYISPFTIIELMIVCKREDIPIKETLFQISRISKLENFSWNYFFKTADYIEKKATIFDALLMSLASEEQCCIISSDHIYKKFGFKTIDLKEN